MGVGISMTGRSLVARETKGANGDRYDQVYELQLIEALSVKPRQNSM